MKKMRAALWVIILVLACAGCGNAGGGDDAGGEASDSIVDASDRNADNEEENTASNMRLEKAEGSVAVADGDGKDKELR